MTCTSSCGLSGLAVATNQSWLAMLPHLRCFFAQHPYVCVQEVYMNKDLLQKLRGGSGSSSSAINAAAKQHHHFRPRPANEAPSQRQQGGSGASQPAPLGTTARPQHQAQQQQAPRAAVAAHRTMPPTAGTAAGSTGGARGSGSRPGSSRLVATDISSMFLPRKPTLPRTGGSLNVSDP